MSDERYILQGLTNAVLTLCLCFVCALNIGELFLRRTLLKSCQRATCLLIFYEEFGTDFALRGAAIYGDA